jgi:hypothetical protein
MFTISQTIKFKKKKKENLKQKKILKNKIYISSSITYIAEENKTASNYVKFNLS